MNSFRVSVEISFDPNIHNELHLFKKFIRLLENINFVPNKCSIN